MKITVEKSNISGAVEINSSKSFFHRVLLSSFLCFDEKTELEYVGVSNDVKTTIAAIEALGARFDGKAVFSPKNPNKSAEIDVGESGTTLRLLLPVLCALDGEYRIKRGFSLQNRPIGELVDVLNAHGGKVSVGERIEVFGKLRSGVYEIAGDISSQYISGLLFALPLLDGDSEIRITSPLKSSSYVKITLSVLKAFGIKIDRSEKGFSIKGNQKYLSPKKYVVEGDYSTASYFLLIGALCGETLCKNLDENSLQGDEKFVDILKTAGARIERKKDGIYVKKSELSPIVVDVDETPDLAPTLAVMCAFSKGKSVLKNIERLKYKESDRVESIKSLLESIGIKSQQVENDLIIFGGNPKSPSECIKTFSDHRIAMSGAIALIVLGGVLSDAESVKKSCPDFFEKISSIGGKIK